MLTQKVKSLNIVKENNFEGILKGIKGQYLIFEDNSVFNIRSNEGLQITIKQFLMKILKNYLFQIFHQW